MAFERVTFPNTNDRNYRFYTEMAVVSAAPLITLGNPTGQRKRMISMLSPGGGAIMSLPSMHAHMFAMALFDATQNYGDDPDAAIIDRVRAGDLVHVFDNGGNLHTGYHEFGTWKVTESDRYGESRTGHVRLLREPGANYASLINEANIALYKRKGAK